MVIKSNLSSQKKILKYKKMRKTIKTQIQIKNETRSINI